MLQQEQGDDYVVASGELHSVEELVDRAVSHAGLAWREHVRVDEALLRGAAELHDLVGDPRRARERLGWTRRVGFDDLVRLLVDSAVEELRSSTG